MTKTSPYQRLRGIFSCNDVFVVTVSAFKFKVFQDFLTGTCLLIFDIHIRTSAFGHSLMRNFHYKPKSMKNSYRFSKQFHNLNRICLYNGTHYSYYTQWKIWSMNNQACGDHLFLILSTNTMAGPTSGPKHWLLQKGQADPQNNPILLSSTLQTVIVHWKSERPLRPYPHIRVGIKAAHTSGKRNL